MTMETKSPSYKGPYLSIDNDELYLPVEIWTYNKARSEAASWAKEFTDVWGRSKYTGKRYVPLHNHEDWEDCCTCPEILSWCFELYEGTPRWPKL
jgi:hypothetical protein